MKTLIFPSEPGVLHATHPGGIGTTLCSDATEGVNGDDEAFERAGRVSCPRGIAIIEWCRTMPRTWRAPQP